MATTYGAEFSATETREARFDTVDSLDFGDSAAPFSVGHSQTMQEKRLLGRSQPEMCGKLEEKRLRVIIIIVASLVMIGAAIAAAVSVAATPLTCAQGFCASYSSNYTVVRNMPPNQEPSFLRFVQTVSEAASCTAPRAFVVGGAFTNGWAQRWALQTNIDTTRVFSSAEDLVLNTSGLLNWPHSVSVDACSGDVLIANANDDVIDVLGCKDPVVGDDFQTACDSFDPLRNFTRDFYNPLGLHEVVQSGSSSASGSCSGADSNGVFIVTGGTEPTDSYVGKYTRTSEPLFLVPASEGEFNKVYSPTVRANGSLLVADFWNDRIAQVDCYDSSGAAVSCVADAAASGKVSTALSTYRPRAVEVAIAADGTEVAFVAGGTNETSTTYVKQLHLSDGSVSTLLHGVFNRPHCITVDPASLDLVVCDKGNSRVVRIPCETGSS